MEGPFIGKNIGGSRGVKKKKLSSPAVAETGRGSVGSKSEKIFPASHKKRTSR